MLLDASSVNDEDTKTALSMLHISLFVMGVSLSVEVDASVKIKKALSFTDKKSTFLVKRLNVMAKETLTSTYAGRENQEVGCGAVILKFRSICTISLPALIVGDVIITRGTVANAAFCV